MAATTFRRTFLILLVVVVSIAFIAMIQVFLMTMLLAALFSGVAYPVHRGLVRILRGTREHRAPIATLLLLLTLVIVPLLVVAGAVANEAQQVNDTLLPKLQQMVNEPGELERHLRPLPGYSPDRALPRADPDQAERADRQRRRLRVHRALGDDDAPRWCSSSTSS